MGKRRDWTLPPRTFRQTPASQPCTARCACGEDPQVEGMFGGERYALHYVPGTQTTCKLSREPVPVEALEKKRPL